MLLAALTLLSLSTVLCETQQGPELMYKCAHKYFRVGNNCYHLSAEKVTWREAIFKCNDLQGQLAVLDSKLEDQKLRKYLNRHKPDKNERWTAGFYDANNQVWRWAYKGDPFKYQGFSRQRRKGNAWKCTVMDYYLLYRWNSRSCLQKKRYICERPMEIIKSNKGAVSSNVVKKMGKQKLRILKRRKHAKKKQTISNNVILEQ
ncbi:hypothetical protein GE061_012204 [Apolygus lucorum]|uniref:C-type lectin domain-containing protein n=1 Tax=Apolygus lucorum TaxID=248454 RepID=A0A8S9XRP4_APOLU|nr:hypothetical protein GE061_012204 [Apolygus lucorum]